MKKNLLFLGFFLTYFFSAHADKESNIYIAPVWEYGVSHWGNGVKQKGSLWGGCVGYSYQKPNDLYFNLEFTAAAGRWTGGEDNPTQEYVTESRFGYVCSPNVKNFTLIPFIGIGSYVFNQSPDFTSYFWYLPIGLRLEYRITAAWKIALLGLGSPTFSGFYKISYRGRAPTTPLWKGELPVSYQPDLSSFTCSIIPFVKSWSYHSSGELVAQQNMYYGLRLALGYRF